MNLNLRWFTWLGLICTPFLIAGGQVLFKLASREVGDFNLRGVVRLLFSPYLITALVVYGLGTIIWIYVLRSVPLTIAYSFMGLTFCVVPVLALLWLNEPLTWKYAGGAVLIMTGMLIINTQG